MNGLYFRQLVKQKAYQERSYLFIQWNTKDDRGLEFGSTREDKPDRGGWEYDFNNNKTSFRLELLW